MKKTMIMVLCIAALAAGCSKDTDNNHTYGKTSDVESVLEEGMAQADNESRTGSTLQDAPAPEYHVDEETVLSEDLAVDVDLTAMSSSMVYSVVYDMMLEPESYIGYTVKMRGSFATLFDEKENKRLYACVIQDATQCCAQGVEFVLRDDRQYPDDYPAEGEEITVTGVFDSYTEGHYIYCVLNDAVMD